jgi:predicted Zn finger-like uncharacterized protein
MIIQCDKCETKFKLDDSAIKGKGVKVKCTKCQNVFVVMPPPQAAQPVVTPFEEPAKPASKRTPADELGFSTDKDESWGLGGGSDAADAAKSSFGADFDFGEDEKQAPVKSGSLDDEFGLSGSAWGAKEAESKAAPADDFGLDFGLGGAGSEKAQAKTDDFSADFDFGGDKGGKAEEKADDFGDFGDIDMGFGKEAEAPAQAPPAMEAPSDEEISFEPQGSGEGIPASFEERDIPGEGPSETEAGGEAKAGEKSMEIPGIDEQDEYLKDIGGAPAEAASSVKKGFAAKKAVLAAVLIIVALAAGLHLTGILDMLMSPKAEQKPRAIAFDGLKGFYVENEKAGRIFAIEGKVTNVSEEPQELAGVMANIYGKDGNKLISKTVSLGAIISSEELKTLAGEDITKHFQEVSRGSIPPKGSSPVMFVFTAVPEGLAEFDVEALR